MSEMEYHAGIAKEVFPIGKTYVDKIQWLKNRGHIFDYEEEDDTSSDTLIVLFSNRFFEIDDMDIEDECIAIRQDNGSFRYTLAWYNGGAGFEEVLEEAIKKEEEE